MTDLLNNRYELGEVVGTGGMGAVYRATDTRLGRTVAVKTLRGGPLADETSRSRMRSEANLAASIHHPGVAQIYDFDEGSPTSHQPTFIVMQFVEGHSLAQLLNEQGPMPPEQVMSVVVQVAEGLQAAHEAGVVHRDLKPANIMLTPTGRTVLVDFGIARSSTSEPLTDTGALIGTADYMSPEQASGRPATAQSDLYALGVVAYHCLTGTSPFRRDSHVATALAHLEDDLPPLGPGVSSQVVSLVESMTAKNPLERPSSAAAVALQAAAMGAARSIDLPPTFEHPPSEHPPSELDTPTGVMRSDPSATMPVGSADTGRSRGRAPFAMYAGIGLLLLVLALVGVQQSRGADAAIVPSVVGTSVEDASAQIKEAGMTVRRRAVDLAGKTPGEVVKQSPAGGSPSPGDGAVVVFVASGKVAVSADEVIGMTYTKASTMLERLGFEVGRKDVRQAANAGDVVALDRSGRLPDGSAITLSVAVAPAAAPALPSRSPSAGSSEGDTSAGKGEGNGKGRGRDK